VITYIVSAYDRPAHLRCCLASLALQEEPKDVIVACNSLVPEIRDQHNRITHSFDFGCVFPARDWGATECYDAIEAVVKEVPLDGDWLCFPSDDSYYVPAFSKIMMDAARANDWELVYCDMLYDERSLYGAYSVFPVDPWPCSIDKTCFILKRERFIPFPGKVPGGASASDGLLVQQLVKDGIRHGKAPGVLVVHN